MTNLLIIDLKATGSDPGQHHPLELGAVFYSVTHRYALHQLSTLLPVDPNPAENINRTNAEASYAALEQLEAMMMLLAQWAAEADYLVAHNAAFIRQWFGRGFLPVMVMPWLCTDQDFIWPKNPHPTDLWTTAHNHGIEFSDAHSPLTNCQLIAALFDQVASQNPKHLEVLVNKAIAHSTEPYVYAVTDVKVNFRLNKKITNKRMIKMGFHWSRYVDGKWAKKLQRSDLKREKAIYPFEVTVQTIASVKSAQYKQVKPCLVPLQYQQLEQFLKAQDWRKANEETDEQIHKAVRQNHVDGRWGDYDALPCENLRIIDQLWVYYSQRHFGFSVQKWIYEELGGIYERDSPDSTIDEWTDWSDCVMDQKRWKMYREAVGWLADGSEASTFALTAPAGHLPVVVINLWEFVCLGLRLQNCNI